MERSNNKIGRPLKAAENKRTSLIKIMATEAERAELLSAADRASMPLSTWVRAVALEKARTGS